MEYPPFVTVEQFIRDAPAQPPDRVKDLVPGGSLVLVSGAPGSGKTHFAFEVARAVANGDRAFGTWQAQGAPVAIVEEEHHPGNLAARLQRVVGPSGVTLHGMHVLHRAKVKLTDPGWVGSIVQGLKRGKVGLCVLDPFADLHDCDEDKATEIGPVVEAMRALTEGVPDCAFIVLHHTTKATWGSGKGALADARGSGRIAGAFDVLYTVRQVPRLPGEDVAVRLVCGKNKEGPAVPETRLGLALNGHTAWTATAWEEGANKNALQTVSTFERVRDAFEERRFFDSFQELVDHIGGNRNLIHDAVEQLVSDGFVKKTPGPGRSYRLELVP